MSNFLSGFEPPPADGQPSAISPQNRPGTALEVQWTALQRAADAVATLAGEGRAAKGAENGLSATPPPALRQLDERRRRLIEEGLGDLVAIMEPGLTALLAIHRSGGDPTAPASALWREFLSARGALEALARAGSFKIEG